MTSSLRKAHKYIWLAIALIVPLLMFLAVKDSAYHKYQRPPKTALKLGSGNTIVTDENNFLTAVVHRSENAIKIDFEIKTPLKSASSEVYELNKNKEKGNYLGLINSAKVYSFNLRNTATGILIYDSLKETEITKLQF